MQGKMALGDKDEEIKRLGGENDRLDGVIREKDLVIEKNANISWLVAMAATPTIWIVKNKSMMDKIKNIF